MLLNSISDSELGLYNFSTDHMLEIIYYILDFLNCKNTYYIVLFNQDKTVLMCSEKFKLLK